VKFQEIFYTNSYRFAAHLTCKL